MISGILIICFQLLSVVVLIYCVLSFVMPGSNIFKQLGKIVLPILQPFRNILYKLFPKLRYSGVDFSPLLLWLAIDIVTWIVRMLSRLV